MRPTLVIAAFLAMLVPPAFGKTYKSTYPLTCTEVWSAVKATLSDGEHYEVVENDDSKMTASYNVKHQAHVTITGAILQRTNKVSLVPKGGSCEMQVVSNFSGWEHTDRRDFKDRVDQSLVKVKGGTPAVAPAQPVKQETPAN
jgi:hypothetical protein